MRKGMKEERKEVRKEGKEGKKGRKDVRVRSGERFGAEEGLN